MKSLCILERCDDILEERYNRTSSRSQEFRNRVHYIWQCFHKKRGLSTWRTQPQQRETRSFLSHSPIQWIRIQTQDLKRTSIWRQTTTRSTFSTWSVRKKKSFEFFPDSQRFCHMFQHSPARVSQKSDIRVRDTAETYTKTHVEVACSLQSRSGCRGTCEPSNTVTLDVHSKPRDLRTSQERQFRWRRENRLNNSTPRVAPKKHITC